MGLRDILKKKDKIEGSDVNRRDEAVNRLAAPEFTFMRSDTHTQEIIHPPSDPNDAHGSYENINYLSAADAQPQSSPTSTGGGGGGGGGGAGSRPRRLSDVFGSLSRNSSTSSRNGAEKASTSKPSRRLTQKLHLSRAPASSENVPANLPEIIIPQDGPDADRDGTESQWERRATILAKTAGENEAVYRSRPHTPTDGEVGEKAPLSREFAGLQIQGNSEAKPVASSPAIDADIQQAIRLHEEGELEKSTTLFAKLADPNGANNPLSQVLYGLALRYVKTPQHQLPLEFMSKCLFVVTTTLHSGVVGSGAPFPSQHSANMYTFPLSCSFELRPD